MLPCLAFVCVNVDSGVKLSCTNLQGNCLTALPRSHRASSPCYNTQMTPASSQCSPDMLMACSLLTSLFIRNLCQGASTMTVPCAQGSSTVSPTEQKWSRHYTSKQREGDSNRLGRWAHCHQEKEGNSNRLGRWVHCHQEKFISLNHSALIQPIFGETG